MRKWVLSTWLPKAGDWDCVDTKQVSAGEAAGTLEALKLEYGTPTTHTASAGESVVFLWQPNGAQIRFEQQPCN